MQEIVNTDFKYRVSVIVPVYNQEDLLERCIDSLLAQDMTVDELEILLVNDGSTDRSPAICDSFALMHANIKVLHKKNGGLSDARNHGIKNAQGKYLMFLDSDDYIKDGTIRPVVDFFDTIYDEVDLVSYPSVSIVNGQATKPHYRYKAFKETAVYDLRDRQNIYAAVTRIEVCVKNLGSDNILFSSDRTFRHEDQKYCTDVILMKLKVGFCNEGLYCYEQTAGGLQQTYFHAYYIFESTMVFWEEEFAKFPTNPPEYLQALYLSDLAWKLKSNILFPHHYSKEKLDRSVERIKALMEHVSDWIIENHPALDAFTRAYFLQLKPNCNIQCFTGKNSLYLASGNRVVYSRAKIEIILLRLKCTDDGIVIKGFLKSPCFQFTKKPSMEAVMHIDGVKTVEDVSLSPSSWSFNGCKEKINQFYGFTYKLPNSESSSVHFFVHVDGYMLDTNYYFMPRAVFSAKAPRRYAFIKGNYRIHFKHNTIGITQLPVGDLRKLIGKQEELYNSNLKRKLIRSITRRINAQGRRIWLYHDCHGVLKNNAYDQFIHDDAISDGVERYYVVNDDISLVAHLFTKDQLKRVIRFKGKKHKLLFLSAEKILTAYIETNNYMAFSENAMKYYNDLFHADIVYLQHGVLHAYQPWKYSLDRLLIDKEVISTRFEHTNLIENFCFDKDSLIKAGMPRYDFIDSKASAQRKILFAPSWRKYLIRQKSDGQWASLEDRYLSSTLFKEVNAFLSSDKLAEMLDKFDYTLDVKLHPIFAEFYSGYFDIRSERISLASSTVKDSDYQVFITDFSSYRFDFVYLKRSIMYFFPDYEMFRSGMCDYRETCLPIDGFFGDMALDSTQALLILEKILLNDGKPSDKYLEQMDKFFYWDDFNQRDRIYKALTGKCDSLPEANDAESVQNAEEASLPKIEDKG